MDVPEYLNRRTKRTIQNTRNCLEDATTATIFTTQLHSWITQQGAFSIGDAIARCWRSNARHVQAWYFTNCTLITCRRTSYHTAYTTHVVYCEICGPGWRSRYSDSLRAGRSGDRIPVEVRFSAPVKTGPWGPTSLLYNGYRVSFSGVKRSGRGVNHPPQFSAEVKEKVELCVWCENHTGTNTQSAKR